MSISHYVPRLTLRKFNDKICLFNIQTGEYRENVQISKAFIEKNYYSEEIEEELNKKIESTFSNLFKDKIDNAENIIELSRSEMYLIKKFLLISVIRSRGNEKFMADEKLFYVHLNERKKRLAQIRGEEYEEVKPPFEEKNIPGETLYQYWMRTLKVILDSNGTPEDILNQPDKTYPAHRWAQVINNGYLAFWDSEFEHDEYVISDVGMTSENELGWNGITVHNHKKTEFLLSLMEKHKNTNYLYQIINCYEFHKCFTENFMMFPISAKRMIVEIDPFFKFRYLFRFEYKMIDLKELTKIPNEKLFAPNRNFYVLPQIPNQSPVYHPDDKYVYEIKKLTSKETRYCNELFLDRIDKYVGFSSLSKVVGSLYAYYRTNSYPYTPRVDYTEMYEKINKEYLTNIDISKIRGFRR